MKTAIHNCTLFDSQRKTALEHASVLWEEGRILASGAGISIPSDASLIDARGAWVTPGLIDGYSQLGLKETGIRQEGDDSWEIGIPDASFLRALDGINPFDASFREARENGVTTSHIGPGRQNVLSGLTAVLKTVGDNVRQMAIAPVHGASVSLGEIPKGAGTAAPRSRMGIAAKIRERLMAARLGEEHDPWSRLFQGDGMTLFMQANRGDDIATCIRLQQEFGIPAAIVHAADGGAIATSIAAAGLSVIGGPLFIDRRNDELKQAHPSAYVAMHRQGIPLSLTSGHPMSAIRYLGLEASLAIREGLSLHDALHALTYQSAVNLGLSHRIGSLAPGMDADLLIWDGEPLELTSRVRTTYIDGQRVYCRERGAHHS